MTSKKSPGRLAARRSRSAGVLSQRWRTLPPWGRFLGYSLMVLAALSLPNIPGLGDIMTPGSSWERVLVYPIGIYILLALGLNVVVGYTGLLDLGFVAFFAIGAYTMAILGTEFGFGFWLTLPIAIALSMLAGPGPGHPDPAAARGLPGDRDPGLRRDHPGDRHQPRVARRAARHQQDPAAALGAEGVEALTFSVSTSSRTTT